MDNCFINDDGYTSYKHECGCEGTFIPMIGWSHILCDEHESELDEMEEAPIRRRTRMRSCDY